jgi:glycerate 2-kinase
MRTPSRDLLESLFRVAVAAAHPSACLPSNLPELPLSGRLVILAAGKAAGSMTEVAERYYLAQMAERRISADRLAGVAVARHGYGRPTRRVAMIEAGHPVPDEAGAAGAERALALADAAAAEAKAGADGLVLVLLSGGASANWIAPVSGITLAQKQAVTRALLRSGANIGEINTVRKHLSRIKGGRLAARVRPARLTTLSISDVPGDDPAVIGSGPTVPDPSTLADARAIVGRYSLDLPEAALRALADPANESPKPGDRAFDGALYRIVARPADALAAAKARAEAAGYECVMLGDRVQGEAREVAAEHARLAKELSRNLSGNLTARGGRTVILSGGELTVTLRGGGGQGGPNQEYALALAMALAGARGIAALAADTDGTDGGSGRPDDPAGAFVDPTTLERAAALGLDPAAFLADNDSTGFFNGIGDLFKPGPTFTNVTDFRAIVVDSTSA